MRKHGSFPGIGCRPIRRPEPLAQELAADHNPVNRMKTLLTFLEKRHDDLPALRILAGEDRHGLLTTPLLFALTESLKTEDHAWTLEALWQASGGSGDPEPADIAPLVRLAFGQTQHLEPHAESTKRRFAEWVSKRNTPYTRDQLAFLERVRDRIARDLTVVEGDLDTGLLARHGGQARGHKLFGKWLPRILEELNQVLAA